uniref:Uncharacterized protein n=1 Tax=Panagrolaimus superbus TaxID=310955 RepID=A0A914YWD3_9BILA
MTQLPGLPGFPTGPFVGVNPIPELPPIPESRLDGKYDNDGNFVPNSTPKPDKQILENRIHGVKIEPFKAAPNHFLHSQNDPPRSYANARGVEIVTVEPQQDHHQKAPRRSNLHSSGSSEAQDEDDEGVQPHRPKNARQWQTTATKLVNHQTAIEPPHFLTDKSIESIDKIIDEHGDKDHAGQSRHFQGSAEIVHPFGAGSTPKPPSNRREIFTTKLLLGALGFQADSSTPQPLHSRRNNHRLPAKVVKPQNRLVKPRRPAPPPPPHPQQHFFDSKSKQRTFQPEQKFVTKPPQIRSRIVPNRPQQLRQPTQKRPQPPPQPRQPLPVIIPILPPQPWNRDPQDAAFLHEVEEYDWRLHYKQQFLQQGTPTATQLRGYSRAQGEPQHPGHPHNSDYEDFIAIRNREYFTDNPPQRNLALPEAARPEASEVLIPFNNAQAQLSHTNFAQTGTRIASNSNNQGNGLPQIGGQPSNYFSPPVTQNPVFGGLFNLFNLNGQQGGGLFPGFGRK